jgi:hypothetical protein
VGEIPVFTNSMEMVFKRKKDVQYIGAVEMVNKGRSDF